jgi:hypothetical protein
MSASTYIKEILKTEFVKDMLKQADISWDDWLKALQ